MKRMAKWKKRKEKNVSDTVKGYKVFESDWPCTYATPNSERRKRKENHIYERFS